MKITIVYDATTSLMMLTDNGIGDSNNPIMAPPSAFAAGLESEDSRGQANRIFITIYLECGSFFSPHYVPIQIKTNIDQLLK